jgi:ABC-type phosphate/phosphonate transport system ATPase subunit
MVDISLQNIKKAFEEGKDILDGLTFEINEGERVGCWAKTARGKRRCLKSWLESWRRTRASLHPEGPECWV